MHKPLLPPAYFIASICAMLALHFLLSIVRILPFPWTLLGIAPVIAGVALNLAADRAFKRHQTTVKPFELSTSLITEGVFRVSRNPMYLGMVLILLGLAIVLGTLTPFAVCAAFAVLLHYRFVRTEERMLAEKFGADWRAYRGQVRRWI